MSKEKEASNPAVAVSLSEAAARLGVGLTTMKNLVWCGAIPTFRIGRRRLVPVSALAKFVESRLSAVRLLQDEETARRSVPEA
jgi:excisionase family DNA binding protein